ncbi:MAG: ROK family protein [Candidatus Glassbacteria bacterium]|nr:ROK family protein [Candidatus Glassbacteria bacterium]
MARDTCTVGIDLGGTNIVFGLVTPQGELIHHFSHPTEGHKGPDRVMQNILDGIEEIMQAGVGGRINGIGLGSPGAIDTESGLVIECAPNIPDWTGRQIRTPIVERFGLPTFVDNDAKMAVIGEAVFGAGAGYRHLFVVTLGTGIGGGVVLNGRIHRGAFFCAGEIGHAAVQINGRRCVCGKDGHLEAYASAKGIVGLTRELLEQGRKSALTSMAEKNEEGLTAKLVLDAARSGDEVALEVVNLAAHYLGMALAHFAMVFDPDIMVVSGGLALAGEILFRPMNEAYTRYLFYQSIRQAPIVPARMGFEAGMVGAAAMAMIELGLEGPETRP